MKLQNLVIGFIAIVALAAGLLGFTRSTQQTPPSGAVSTNQPTETFYFHGGLTSKIQPFVSTTTVACMIQNPLSATTTFSMVGVLTNAATTTTTVLGIATTTNANRFATTTALKSVTIAANAQGVVTYRPTTANDILGPGEWIQVGYGAGTTLSTVAQQQSAQCSAVFEVLK